MIRPCRKVLKNLRKLSQNSEDVLCFLGDKPYICRSDDFSQFYDYTPYQKEIFGIIRQLAEDGYLQYDFNEYHFSITQLGLHPYQFKWESIKSFLFTSVFIPVVVSIITTILTLIIKSWLPWP